MRRTSHSALVLIVSLIAYSGARLNPTPRHVRARAAFRFMYKLFNAIRLRSMRGDERVHVEPAHAIEQRANMHRLDLARRAVSKHGRVELGQFGCAG